jgi:hypothetical protein
MKRLKRRPKTWNIHIIVISQKETGTEKPIKMFNNIVKADIEKKALNLQLQKTMSHESFQGKNTLHAGKIKLLARG